MRAAKEMLVMQTVRFLVLAIVMMLFLSQSSRSADHVDAPGASADPAADITDVFAWMSPDAQRVFLNMSLVRMRQPHRSSRTASSMSSIPPAGLALGLPSRQRLRSSVPLTRRRLFSAGRGTTRMSPATPAIAMVSSRTTGNSASLLACGMMPSSSTSLAFERQAA